MAGVMSKIGPPKFSFKDCHTGRRNTDLLDTRTHAHTRAQTRAHAHTLRTLRCPPVTPSTVFFFLPQSSSLLWLQRRPAGVPMVSLFSVSRLSVAALMECWQPPACPSWSRCCPSRVPMLSLLSSVVPCGSLCMERCNPFGPVVAAPSPPSPFLAPPPASAKSSFVQTGWWCRLVNRRNGYQRSATAEHAWRCEAAQGWLVPSVAPS